MTEIVDINPPLADGEVIQELEDLLKLAYDGVLVEIVCIGRRIDNSFLHVNAGETEDPYAMIGALTVETKEYQEIYLEGDY